MSAGLPRWALLALALVATAGCTSVRSASVPPPAPTPAPPPASPRPAPPRKEPPPVLAPQVSGEEEQRLSGDARSRIEAAEKVVGQLDQQKLARRHQEMLATIQDFLAKAKDAMAARDVQRAFTLADKALALANDLSRSAR